MTVDPVREETGGGDVEALERATALAERYGDAIVRIGAVLDNDRLGLGKVNHIRAIVAGLDAPAASSSKDEGASEGYCGACGCYMPLSVDGSKRIHDCDRTPPLDGLPPNVCACPTCGGHGASRWGCWGTPERPHEHAYMKPVHELVRNPPTPLAYQQPRVYCDLRQTIADAIEPFAMTDDDDVVVDAVASAIEAAERPVSQQGTGERCDACGVSKQQVLRKHDEAAELVRRAAPFVNAVAAMAHDKAPALTWLADAAARIEPVREASPPPSEEVQDAD